jgi:hypothetical protein
MFSRKVIKHGRALMFSRKVFLEGRDATKNPYLKRQSKKEEAKISLTK